MEQFKMLIRDVDLKMIKETSAASLPLRIEILNETHIDKEFWQVEILAEEMFQIYHIGRLVGYKEGLKESQEKIDEYAHMANVMIKKSQSILDINTELQQEIKNLKNGN